MAGDCPLSLNRRLVGDPVDTFTGATLDLQQDFRLAGPLPFQWWRHYDSARCHKKYSLGWGQAHDFDRWLKIDQDGLTYFAPLRRSTHYPPLASDGDEAVQDGLLLRRLSGQVFQVHEYGKPFYEFRFGQRSLAPLVAVRSEQHAIKLDYDEHLRLRTILDSVGNEIGVEHSTTGVLTRVFLCETDSQPQRDLIRYEYDGQGNLTCGLDGFNNQFSLRFDPQHRLVQKTDRIGHSFLFEYDSSGRCIRTRGDDGVVERRIEYLKPQELTRVTHGNGAKFAYRYEMDRLASITNPLGGVEQFIYDDAGNLLEKTDPLGNTETLIPGPFGAPMGKRNVFGQFSSIPEDLNEPDPDQHVLPSSPAQYEFGRLIDVEKIAETASGPTDTELGNGPESYVGQANLYSQSNLGFVVGKNWWPAPETGRRFDATGDLIHQVDPAGHVRRWQYDGNGNITKFVDFDGGVWRYQYESWNHLTSEVNPLDIATQLEYDSQENLVRFVDGGNTESQYKYDLNDGLTEVWRHGELRERYERDTAGNLIAKYAADGRLLLRREIGVGNRVTKRTLASGDEHSYEYDKHGRFVAANSQAAEIEFSYDHFGNRCVEKRNGIGVEHRNRGWKKLGQSLWLGRFLCQQQILEDGSLEIVDPTGGRHNLRVSDEGSVTQKFTNGTVVQSQFDHLGRCTSKSVRRRTDVWNRTFEWSGEGELRRRIDSRSGEQQFEYDAAHRLSGSVNSSGQRENYLFDNAGNLLEQPGLRRVSLAYGNRLLRTQKEGFEYNDRNHISRRFINSSTGELLEETKYEYDSRDQLVKIELPNGTWEAEYDALGRRVSKTYRGQKTEYLWNTDQLAGEIAPDGRFRLYIYVDPLALTPILFVDYESIESDPARGDVYVVHSDQIGTPTCIENRSGEVVWQADIAPYGQARLSEANQIEFNLRFPGHYHDDETGLHYNRFRYYDPCLGRYIQSDPIGIAGGANVYAYPANPLLDVDLQGLECATCKSKGKQDCECGSDEERTSGSSMPDWLRARLEAGNEFNRQNRPRYPFNEVQVDVGASKKFVVDSYDMANREIVSRKFTQLSDVKPETAVGYLQEFVRKYPEGATITDSPFNPKELRGQRLQGDLILEVPPQNKPIPQNVLDAAAERGIVIRDSDGTVY